MHTQSRVWKLSEAIEELPELKRQVKSLEEETRELKDRLDELEKSSQQEREDHQKDSGGNETELRRSCHCK